MEDSSMGEKEQPPPVGAAQTPVAPQPEKRVGLAIGDTAKIIGGRLDETVGHLYGFYPDRIALLPLGVTDRLIEISLVGRKPDPELGIKEIKILKKAAKPGLIPLIDIQAGQFAETFTADGEPGPTFSVKEVDEGKRRIVLEDDAGEDVEVSLTTGIPLELPFRVLRTRDPPVDQELPEGTPEVPPVPQGTPVTPVAVDDKEVLEEGQVLSPEEEAADAARGPDEAAVDFMLGEEIELPAEEEVEEKSTADRYYPDVFQRSEMLGQFIRMLPEKDQRDAIELQKARRFVELFMHLRNEVVKYGVTGEPRGLKQTSTGTLAELVTRPEVSMKKKVVNVDRVLYFDHSFEHFAGEIEGGDQAPGKLEEEGLSMEYLEDVIKRSESLVKTAATELGRETENPEVGLPKFFQFLEQYRQQIQTPFTLNGQGQAVQEDEEAFLREIPSLEDKPVNVLNRLPSSIDKKVQFAFPPPDIKSASFSIRRFLKQRWGRFNEGEKYRVVETADAPQFDTLLIFPKSAERVVGPIRSGNLAKDVSLGMQTPELMEDLLGRLGDVTDFPTADGILSLGVKGNILGNVSVKDWLDSQDILFTGYGDVIEYLHGYGLKSVELNQEQAAVLNEKVRQYLAALKIFLTKEREENKVAQQNLKFEAQPLLPAEAGARLEKRILSEPLLVKVLEGIQQGAGELSKIDINWFTYIYLAYPDYLLSVLGQQADQVAKERLKHVRDLYLDALRNAYRAKNRILESGVPPVENACPHVKAFEAARKYQQLKSDEPRDLAKTKLLLKEFNKFRGKTEEDWVWCNVCNKHLMCAHEVLQLQEVIRQKEQETLHKELLIKFSGGQFGGKFICRNCGQGISDLDFDTNLEFDDEGRPMIGRSVMVDPDQAEVDELENMLKGPAEGEEEELDLGSEELNTMLKTLKRICGLMGINPEEKDYRTMVEEFSAYNNSLPTREQYAEQMAGQKAEGKRVQDYDIFYSIRYVTAAGAITLLNTQTHVPDYIRYYVSTECKDGFMGYPLEENEKEITGIECLATVIASINDPEFPWNSTTLQRQPDLQRRKAAIIELLQRQVATFAKQPIQQAALQKKREYRMKLYGKLGDVKGDQISKNFRPIPFMVSAEEAAAAPIIAGTATPSKQATAWMRLAHRIAMENAALNSESPLSETTCCLHKITNPTEFWDSNKGQLPELEARSATQKKYRSATATTTFETTKPKPTVGQDDPSQYYKLFMRVCYQGENQGLPHKLGLTLTCSECGLNFQTNPNLPLTSESDKKKAVEEEGKAIQQIISHMEGQGLVITQELFERVLTASHQRSQVSQESQLSIPNLSQTLPSLGSLPNPPLRDWTTILAGIKVALAELGPSPSRTQLAQAAEALVQQVSEKEEFIRARLGSRNTDFLLTLLQKTPRECGELLKAYFLVPFQRWQIGITKDAFKILDSYDLSSQTKDDILSKGLGNHFQPLGQGLELEGFMLKKVRQFVKNMSVACNEVFPKLRSLLTPGGSTMVKYIQRAYVIGYVHMLVDPHTIPIAEEADEEEEGGGPPNLKVLYKALETCILRYAQGSKVPTEEEIRISLEKRAEKEKQVFIQEQDTMTREERRVMQNLKKYGMGRWAVGGSKAIRQYDPERYEAERTERAMAGFTDYPGLAEANAAEGLGNAEFDMFGGAYAAAYDQAAERGDGGYDHDQMREDDY
jgi:hypothetical protein